MDYLIGFCIWLAVLAICILSSTYDHYKFLKETHYWDKDHHYWIDKRKRTL